MSPRPLENPKVAQMYVLYESGHSLAQVGKAFSVTRQTVYEAFRRRGWTMRSRTLQPTISFEGDSYSIDSYGYYRKTDGNRRWLHQSVWESAYGSIPPGMEIHHTDGDKLNNALDNLACLTPSQHAQIHRVFGEEPEKYCLYCGERLHRKLEPSGKVETPAAMHRRSYCGTRCHGDHRRGKPRGWSANNE